jgi:hypothetical protein
MMMCAKVAKLMSQAGERDDRQMVFTTEARPLLSPHPSSQPVMTFPNVPYEEHKGGH